MKNMKEEMIGLVEGDLHTIEERLLANLDPEVELVRTIAAHTLFAGGKRLRPLLCLLVHRIFGGSYDGIYDAAGIFEFLHAATLIHDDVVDASGLRRGVPASHKLFGAAEAVLTGDFLLSKALVLTARTRNFEVIDTIARITGQMAQGEIEQLRNKGDLLLSESAYNEVIGRKTAVLMEGACKTGALLAGASPEEVENAACYGWELGLAFQVADDLLDYLGDEKTLGKHPGADLREGKATLPLIYALSVLEEKKRDFLLSFGGRDFAEADFASVKDLVEEAGGFRYAEKKAVAHRDRAFAAIASWPDGKPRRLLLYLADYAIRRKY